ncbi:MAG: cellulosome protein dockerin type I, partial [Chitinophagaceae bacterium]
MMKLFTFKTLFFLLYNAFAAVMLVTSSIQPASAQRRMDKLGRGMVAIHQTSGTVFVSWRLLATDPDGIAFNLYRITGSGTEVKLNTTPLTEGTNFTNTGVDITKSNTYFVKPVINNVEQTASGSFTLPANATVKPYIGIPLKSIADGTYYVHHAWPGDLDGNGEYDFVADRLPDGTPTGRTIKLDGYLIDGTFKWQIDLGPNAIISDGHNDGATVYDLDGDGKAEIIVRTSEGTVFGDGTKIGDVN